MDLCLGKLPGPCNECSQHLNEGSSTHTMDREKDVAFVEVMMSFI